MYVCTYVMRLLIGHAYILATHIPPQYCPQKGVLCLVCIFSRFNNNNNNNNTICFFEVEFKCVAITNYKYKISKVDTELDNS